MIPAAADARMVDSTSAASQTNTSPLTGPSSFGSAFDAQGLPTVHEVAYHKTSHDFTSVDHRPSMRRPSGESAAAASHHGSAGSSVRRSFDDKLLEPPPPPLPYGSSSAHASTAAPNSNPSFENKRETMTNGNGHGHANGDHPYHSQHQESPKTDHHRRLSKAKGSRRDKRGGFRNTIRRMLGIQRSPKDRISMPNPMVYPHHVRGKAALSLSSQQY